MKKLINFIKISLNFSKFTLRILVIPSIREKTKYIAPMATIFCIIGPKRGLKLNS